MAKLGKQLSEVRLPSRSALNQISKGDPSQRTINNYSKLSPVDANGVGQMGESILNPPSSRPGSSGS